MIKIKKPVYFEQRDNKLFPRTSCYPSSLAMGIGQCLNLANKTWSDIGKPDDMQPEDFITKITQSKETKKWIKKNISLYGRWMLNYSPRTIAYVENHIFNKLMNADGFESIFSTKLTFDNIKAHMEDAPFTVIMHGNFKKVSSVKGHVVAVVGIIDNEFIVNDPYGNALKGYKDHAGENLIYPRKFFEKKKKRIWAHLIDLI